MGVLPLASNVPFWLIGEQLQVTYRPVDSAAHRICFTFHSAQPLQGAGGVAAIAPFGDRQSCYRAASGVEYRLFFSLN